MTRFCGIGTRFLHLCGSKRAELEKRLASDEITAHCQRDYDSCLMRLRLVVLILLMIVGVVEMWGQPADGFYYICSNKETQYYLCPAENCYLDGDSERPHLTTYNGFGTNLDEAVWLLKKSGSYYYILNAYTGKFVTANSPFTIGGKTGRKAVHLERSANPDNSMLFDITTSSPYNIRWKDYTSGYSFNPTSGNQPNRSPSDGVAGGIIGMFGNSDQGSKWLITNADEIPIPPIMTANKAATTISIRFPIPGETQEGVTYHYTINDDATTHQLDAGGAVNVGSTKGTVRAYAKKGDKISIVVSFAYDFRALQDISSLSEITEPDGLYRLTEDVTASSGPNLSSPFTGLLDCNYKTISGLTSPLFASTDGAVIKNAKFSNVNITTGNHVGAVTGEASGATLIYNCGVLDGSIIGSINAGGLVGHITGDATARIVNCYNYANVSGGDYAAGIVGRNESEETSVRIALCMMYGNVTGATNISPVYTGNHVNNVQNFTEYNFYLYSTEKDALGNRIEKIPYTAYNDQLAIDKEEYLTRFPFYRHILNTHRELACYFLFGDYSKEHVSELGHWTLKKGNNVPKYPIIEAWEENTTKTPTRDHNNLPTTQDDYAGKLLTTMGSSGYLAVTVKIGNSTFSTDLPITDMDTLRYDFTYGKVVLPHANEFSGWTRDYSKICTGWKITNVGSSTSSSVTNYNFADRENPQKDIYDSNNPYIFAQGGNYIVPYNVSSITIEANFATAFYLSDPAYDMGYDTSYGNATQLGGSVPPTYHEKTVYTSLSTLVGALSNTTNPHEQAIVLVGNYHYNMKTLGGSLLNVDRAVTIMSVDEDCNQEPDYGWYSYMNVSRPTAPPLRFDFLPIIPMGMSSHVTGSTAYPGVSIWKVRGWFEMTETCVNIMHQCEIDSGDFTNNDDGKGNNRWIVNSGYFTQIVRSFNKACNKLSYIQIGGNAYVKEFYPGNHSKKIFTNKVVPINVTGGEIEECCMTGYHVGGKLEGNNIYFWGAGGRIHEFLGAYMETPVQASGQTGGVNMNAKIDHARIWQFFGGGTTSAATITGNINVTINNSLVDFYCGGPEFGDMASGKSVTTNATGTTFRNYYGAGFGGTSLTNVFVDENGGLAISNGDTEFPQAFTFYTNRRLKTDNNYGIGTAYKFEYILSSTGEKVVPRWYIGRARFSLATTGSVINNLTNCIVEGDFYGAGCQGKVNGTVSSTLTNCTIKRGVFGGGYKAANNAVKVYPETQPTYSKYNSEKGLFSGFGSVEPDTWKWEQGSSANETYNDQRDELYTQSSITMTDLGNVTGNITLTIDGGYVGGTAQGATPEVAATATTDAIPVGGSVYGGGNESKSLSNTTVTLKGDAVIYGNVFGGGNKAEVQGSTEVNIVNEE